MVGPISGTSVLFYRTLDVSRSDGERGASNQPPPPPLKSNVSCAVCDLEPIEWSQADSQCDRHLGTLSVRLRTMSPVWDQLLETYCTCLSLR